MNKPTPEALLDAVAELDAELEDRANSAATAKQHRQHLREELLKLQEEDEALAERLQELGLATQELQAKRRDLVASLAELTEVSTSKATRLLAGHAGRRPIPEFWARYLETK